MEELSCFRLTFTCASWPYGLKRQKAYTLAWTFGPNRCLNAYKSKHGTNAHSASQKMFTHEFSWIRFSLRLLSDVYQLQNFPYGRNFSKRKLRFWPPEFFENSRFEFKTRSLCNSSSVYSQKMFYRYGHLMGFFRILKPRTRRS